MNNIIRLEDFNNKTLDEIIDLYRSGYSLEDYSQFSIQNLQLSLSTISTIGAIFIAGLAAGMITILLVKKYEK